MPARIHERTRSPSIHSLMVAREHGARRNAWPHGAFRREERLVLQDEARVQSPNGLVMDGHVPDVTRLRCCLSHWVCPNSS